jgi:hypothetical protein
MCKPRTNVLLLIAAAALLSFYCASSYKATIDRSFQEPVTPDNATVVDSTFKLLKLDSIDAADRVISTLNPDTLDDTIRYRLLSARIEATGRVGKKCIEANDYGALFEEIRKTMDRTVYRKQIYALGDLQSVESAPIFRYVEKDLVVSLIANYITLYDVYARYTKVAANDDGFNVLDLSKILPNIDETNPQLAAHKERMWIEENLFGAQIRKVYEVFAQRPQTLAIPMDGCDSLFASASTTFSKPGITGMYLFLLKHSSPSLLFKDSITCEMFGRPFSQFSANIFDLWKQLVKPALWLYASKKQNAYPDDKLSEYAGMQIFSMDRAAKTRRYSIKGIQWLYANIVPDPEGVYFGRSMKALYSALFSKTVRLFALCNRHLSKGSAGREAAAYSKAMNVKGFNGVRYLQNTYGKIRISSPDGDRFTSDTPLYIGFWLRRELDGSAAELWNLLSDFLKRYDNDFYTKWCANK